MPRFRYYNSRAEEVSSTLVCNVIQVYFQEEEGIGESDDYPIFVTAHEWLGISQSTSIDAHLNICRDHDDYQLNLCVPYLEAVRDKLDVRQVTKIE